MVQDWRAFLKAQPLICDRCGMFTDTYRQYCENCGAKYSLRKAKKKDFNLYVKNKEMSTRDQLIEQKVVSNYANDNIPIKTQEPKSIPSESDIINVEKFLKEHPFICVYCWEFSIKDLGYCEKCGSRHSLRKSKKKFFSIYQERRARYLKSLSFLEKPPSKPVLDVPPAEFAKIQESPSISDKWKEKIEESPNEIDASESLQIETKEPKPIPSTSFKDDERIEVTPITQEQKIKPSLEISQPEVIPSIPDEVVEKPKKTINFCKFCGLQLAESEKFCYQCGTIIKHN